MNFSVDREADKRYLRIETDDLMEVDFEEKLLSNQRSEYLLVFHIQFLNQKKFFYYDITGKRALSDEKENVKISRETFLAIVNSLLNISQTVREYLLQLDSLYMKQEMIFYNGESQKIMYVYIPGYKGDFYDDLKNISTWFLECVDYQDVKLVMSVYQFYHLVRQPGFYLQQLSELMKDEKQDEKETDDQMLVFEEKDEELQIETKSDCKNQTEYWYYVVAAVWTGWTAMMFLGMIDAFQIAFLAQWSEKMIYLLGVFLIVTIGWGIHKSFLIYKKYRKDTKEQDQIWRDEDLPAIYDICNVSEYTDNTVILRPSHAFVRLISLNRQITDDLLLVNFPCIVGSQPGEVQAVLNLSGISRQHAKIEMLDQELVLQDLHSTNGTYINGRRLEADEKIILMVDDEIQFADVAFIYPGRSLQA